ncbi:lasso peptide biosynthesis B2 protein [Novosphingobium terrae]|uniref:lasso peptide biosynthesis B2 protein n=1 Tax=Novosphingobium terrae TaxID=2726189 RepID=UPI001980F748|nr:lasso peptide biosynthesis B2 protein [Novosphingobium terrae]
MQGYALNPGVTFCFTGSRAIFLDQIADRYLTLGNTEDLAFSRLLEGAGLDQSDLEQITALVGQGFLQPAKPGRLPQPCSAAPPVTAAHSAGRKGPSGWAQLQFALRVMQARRQLRRHGLYKSLESFRIGRVSRTQHTSPSLAVLGEATELLRTISRYMTRHDQCLPISLGLARYLQNRGVDCKLILGVQLGPFQAHCWVQHGNQLIGDDLDMVRTFTPILAV